MKCSIFLFIIFLTPLLSIKANAQAMTGCGKSGTFQIYYEQDGFGVGFGNTAKPRYNGAFSTLTSDVNVCPRFASAAIMQPVTLCCIGTDCAINNYIYDFTNIPCPLDDNIIVLILITACLGFFYLRNRQVKLAIVSNQTV